MRNLKGMSKNILMIKHDYDIMLKNHEVGRKMQILRQRAPGPVYFAHFDNDVIIISLWAKIIMVATQIREQMSGPDLYVLTVEFLALKKTGFSKKKIFPKKKKKILPFFYATFQCGRYNVFKFFFFFFFDHKKLKKPPSKVAHNRPKPFLRQSSPGHSPQPRSSFPFYKKSNAILSLLLSALNIAIVYRAFL